MPFIRTVLGDIDRADLGVCYAHEHLVIDGGFPIEKHPDFHLADVVLAVRELEECREAGLRAVVDAMPCDAGRNVLKLAEISRRSAIHVVAPTGLHLADYYDSLHWSHTGTVEEIAGLFIADIIEGIDERDYNGPLVRRTGHRAGVIKVAGSRDRLAAREERAFEAAAVAYVETGCPILTHTQDGTAALDQIELLARHGVRSSAVTLSHTDKVVDAGYHREILSTGAFLEYDQAFRWREGPPNGTLELLVAMFEAGFGDQLMLGTDAARQSYWHAYGGSPGLVHLLTDFSAAMEDRGLGPAERERIFVANPARAFAFSDGR